jgi:hypothetical protein
LGWYRFLDLETNTKQCDTYYKGEYASRPCNLGDLQFFYFESTTENSHNNQDAPQDEKHCL